MTPEAEERFQRIERSLEFMAASGARADARLERLSSELTQMKEVVEQHTRQIGELASQTGELASQIGELGNLVLRFGRVVEEQSHAVDRVISAQLRTDERLNVLINVVERYFSNGRN